MNKIIGIFLVLLFIISGCQSNNTLLNQEENSNGNHIAENWTLSSIFQTNNVILTGIPQIVGFQCGNKTLVEGQTLKCMWYLWIDQSLLQNSSINVTAIHKETGQSENLLAQSISYSPLDGADVSIPSNIAFSKSGIWKIDVLVDQKLFGSIVVEVEQ